MKTCLLVLSALLLLLCIPLRVVFSYREEETFLSLRWLFLKKRLLPEQEKAEEPQKETSGRAEKKKKRKEEKKTSLSFDKFDKEELLSLAKDVLPRCIRPVRTLLRRTTIADFRLTGVIAAGDAAETAILFGKMNAAVYSAVAMLGRVFTLRPEEICLYPDFTGESSRFDCSGEVRLIPLAALAAACNLCLLALGAILRRRKKTSPAERKASNGKQSSHQ